MTVPSATKASSQLAWQLLMADGNDDGARDHRREEPHNAADAKGGDEQTDDQIEQAGERHACAGIRQHPGVGHGQVAVCVRQHGCHNGEATQIGERRTQERGHFLFGDEVEQQSAQTCAEQSGGNAQAREQGHQNGGTKHGEHVLDAQNQHPARAQLTGIINALEKKAPPRKSGNASEIRMKCKMERKQQHPCFGTSNLAYRSPLSCFTL